MPDLDIIYVQRCIEYQTKEIHLLSSDRKKFYTVTFDPTIFPGCRPRYDGRINSYHCTCPNYKFKAMHKTGEKCKHIKKLQGSFCTWEEFLEGGQSRLQKLNHICPKCYGKTETIMMGV